MLITIITIILALSILFFQHSILKKEKEIMEEQNKALIDCSQYKVIYKNQNKMIIHTYDCIMQKNKMITKETVFENFLYANTVFHDKDIEIIVEGKVYLLKKQFPKENIRVLFPK